MRKTFLAELAALLVGVAMGYLAWGGPEQQSEKDLLRDLNAVTARLEEHEKMLVSLVAERDAEAAASLAACESAQEKIAEELEGCLFAKAAQPAPAPTAAEQPRSGTSKFSESIEYPVPIPPDAR